MVVALQRDVTPPHLVAAMIDGALEQGVNLDVILAVVCLYQILTGRAAPTIFDQADGIVGFSEQLLPS